MQAPGVRTELVLVSMPWADLELPAIQPAVLAAVARRGGIGTKTRHFYLTFAQRLCEAGIGLERYRAVAHEHWRVGLGDWIFAVPPYRERAELADEAYMAY